ncbi:hypothetical protein EDM00_03640 [Ornithobacterium rhinotracheale]|uniref:hypothetical protein n=1 Tax=Ornithobacterium rhinotracheale TaxID=28251 RepID=UPI00129CE282|nr:hypothetical protein [Ornithobacterium rhinotracheale]MRI63088.1 hypothetical protein [Ornithobacterium rhinotracheale]
MLLNSKQIENIVEEIETAIQLSIDGKKDDSLNKLLDIWEEIPIPKQKQPEQISNWVIDCIYSEYFDQGDFCNAKKWALRGLNNDTAQYDSYEYIQMGRVCYELKEYDEAMKYFSIAYERGKKRAFQGFDKKYWEFYSKNKK